MKLTHMFKGMGYGITFCSLLIAGVKMINGNYNDAGGALILTASGILFLVIGWVIED
jgi:hypothetical protein